MEFFRIGRGLAAEAACFPESEGRACRHTSHLRPASTNARKVNPLPRAQPRFGIQPAHPDPQARNESHQRFYPRSCRLRHLLNGIILVFGGAIFVFGGATFVFGGANLDFILFLIRLNVDPSIGIFSLPDKVTVCRVSSLGSAI